MCAKEPCQTIPEEKHGNSVRQPSCHESAEFSNHQLRGGLGMPTKTNDLGRSNKVVLRSGLLRYKRIEGNKNADDFAKKRALISSLVPRIGCLSGDGTLKGRLGKFGLT